jgi:hypothetical protein
VLSLAIMTLLISGLLVAGSGFLDSERDRVARDQLNVLGERVAAGVENVDRMAGGTEQSSEAFVRVGLPARTAGDQYRISVNNTTTPEMVANDRPYAYELVLATADETIERQVPVRTHHPVVTGSTVNGGDVVIAYSDETGDAIEIRKED